MMEQIYVAAGAMVTAVALLGLAWRGFIGPAISKEATNATGPVITRLDALSGEGEGSLGKRLSDIERSLEKRLNDLDGGIDGLSAAIAAIQAEVAPAGAIRTRLRRIEHQQGSHQ